MTFLKSIRKSLDFSGFSGLFPVRYTRRSFSPPNRPAGTLPAVSFCVYRLKSSSENDCSFRGRRGSRFKISYLYFRQCPSRSTTPFFSQSTVSLSGERRPYAQYSHFGAIFSASVFFFNPFTTLFLNCFHINTLFDWVQPLKSKARSSQSAR